MGLRKPWTLSTQMKASVAWKRTTGSQAELSAELVRLFRKKIWFLRQAVDERDLYGMKSLHFEKLQGARAHQRSIRLNKQWRLILEIVDARKEKTVRVIGIEDYH